MNAHHPRRILALVLTACSLALHASAQSTRPARDGSSAAFGINLAGAVDWNTELPFVDVFRLARAWISQREGAGWGQGPALELDERGWVKRLEPGCYAETPLCTIEGGHYPSGEYTVLYDGAGRIELAGAARVTRRETRPGGGRLIATVDAARGGFFLRLMETDPADPARHIRVIMPGFEKTYATEPFHPDFLKRWRGVACIRFMDWMDTNGSDVQHWSQRPRPDDATWTTHGVPLEVMLDLCQRLQCDAWFCLPHACDDTYVRQFAAAVRTGLDAQRRVYVELSNEVWNSQFKQHHYAREQATKLGWGPPERPQEGAGLWYSRRSVRIFAIFNDVFGEQRGQPDGRLVRVLAAQAANPWWTEHIILPCDVDGRPAREFADALAIAPYVGMILSPQSKPSSDDVARWSVAQVLDHVERVALPETEGWIRAQAKIAQASGVALIAYEAGQHLVGAGGGENNDELTALLQKANRDPRMGQVYDRYFRAWEDAGGNLLCHFSSVGRWSKWGSWGLLQYADDDPHDYPRYEAVQRWREKLAQ